jgi:hypothetical protein
MPEDGVRKVICNGEVVEPLKSLNRIVWNLAGEITHLLRVRRTRPVDLILDHYFFAGRSAELRD